MYFIWNFDSGGVIYAYFNGSLWINDVIAEHNGECLSFIDANQGNILNTPIILYILVGGVFSFYYLYQIILKNSVFRYNSAKYASFLYVLNCAEPGSFNIYNNQLDENTSGLREIY